MNVLIDSFGWIEYFGGGALADRYGEFIEKASKAEYLTPSVVLYEVYKKIKREVHEGKALEACAYISAYTEVIPLDEKISLEAAEISLRHGLPMADAIIAATGKVFKARIVTGDAHFEKIENVEMVR